jgi:capsular exopolysaccharide synthesis family protein
MKPDIRVAEQQTELLRLTSLPVEENEGAAVDLRTVLRKLWNGRWIIAGCMAVALGLAGWQISMLEPRYTSAAKVMFDLQQTNVVNVPDILVDPEFNQDTLQNEIEVLYSSSLIERVVDKFDLEHDPAFNPYLLEPAPSLTERVLALLPEELRQEVSALAEELAAAAIEPAEETAGATAEEPGWYQRAAVVDTVREGLALKPVYGSRVIEIAFTAADPYAAAGIVNGIAEQYIVDQLEAKLDKTRSATDWLTARVEELRQKVQASEDAVEAKRAELSLAAGQGLEITRQQLDDQTAALSTARRETSALQAQYQRLSAALANPEDLAELPEFRDAAMIQSYRVEERDLRARMATLAAGHPALPGIRAQVANLQAAMAEEAGNIVAGLKVDLDSARAQETALTASVRELESSALAQARAELELRQLERETEASRLLYENFLVRLQETSEQEELESANARVLSPAQPPLFADSGHMKLIVAVAGALGAFLGMGLVFLREMLNNTFRTPQELEAATGRAVLAAVPAAAGRNAERRNVVRQLRDKPGSNLAESVRNLRTSILFSNLDRPPRVVMFASAVPREGKSTTAMLTALTSQQMGKSAVIVDCDLRQPALAGLVDTEDTGTGLLSVLDGTATLEEALQRDPESGLHLLVARSGERKAQVNPADVLSSRRFRELIDTLRARYDLVVLDTPPTLVVTDARILSALADAVIFAVRWNQTPRGAVLDGLKELRSVEAPIAGLVMTMVNEASAERYSHDGYHYYNRRYTEYYNR